MNGIHGFRLSLLSEWQELGPKLTTNARFGFQLLLNYTGGALIFIRRECLCKNSIALASCNFVGPVNVWLTWQKEFRYASRIRIIQNRTLSAMML